MSSVEIRDDGTAESALAALDVRLRGKAVRAALSAAARVVVAAARQRCPRSRVTGTRRLWSRSTLAARTGTKDLADTITHTLRDYGERQVAICGPARPAGALGHLVEFSRRKILWGRDSQATIDGRPFLRPAADETRGAQQAAFVAALRSDT